MDNGNPDQENEEKRSSDEQYIATFNQWWGSEFPTMALSFHLNDTEEEKTTDKQSDEINLDRIFEVLCENLPSHVLLIAGEKEDTIDRLINKYIANGKEMRPIFGPIGDANTRGYSSKTRQAKRKNRKSRSFRKSTPLQEEKRISGHENSSYQKNEDYENNDTTEQEHRVLKDSDVNLSISRSENDVILLQPIREEKNQASICDADFRQLEKNSKKAQFVKQSELTLEEETISTPGRKDGEENGSSSSAEGNHIREEMSVAYISDTIIDLHGAIIKGKSARQTIFPPSEAVSCKSKPNGDDQICDYFSKRITKATDFHDVIPSKRDETGIDLLQNDHVLSMYHCRKHYCLRYNLKEKPSAEMYENKKEKNTNTSTGFRKKGSGMTSKHHVCAVYIHLEIPSKKARRNLNIRFSSNKKKAEETIMDRVNNKQPKSSKDEASFTDFDDEEKLRNFLLTSIFRHFLEAMHDDDDEDRNLYDSFVERWYDEDILTALLNNAAKDKSARTKFGFYPAIKDDWIQEFIEDEKIPEPTITYKILFVLCIQNGLDQEVSFKFWIQGKNTTAMALMAYKVSKNMRERFEGSELGEKMEIQMEDFQNLAIKLLKRCYSENEDFTFELLLGRIPDLQNMTLIDVALAADSEKFIAQKPCRKLMDRLWIEPIKMNNKHFYTHLIVSAICPFLSPRLMEFEESSDLLEDDMLDLVYSDDGDIIREKYSYNEYCCAINLKIQDYWFWEKDDEEETSCCKGFWTNLGLVYVFCCVYVWRIRCFFIAPVIRFTYHAMSHLSYLILFSIVMLTDFQEKISVKEIVLDAWTLILAIEEIKQAITEREQYFDTWNVLDATGILLFCVGFILRMIFHTSRSICPEGLYVARILFAFSLMIFILRTLQLLSIDQTLGPKIHMINRLLRDMVSFMLILAVIVAAYGIGSNIILYPNQPLDIYLLRDIFYDSWWSVLGQFDREDALGDSCSNQHANITSDYCSSLIDPDIDYKKCKESRCPANHWIVPILMVVYAIVTIVMMLNVLIAMFNDVFSKVQEKREQVYNLQRYRLMREYCNKITFPAPLCVITYWGIIPWMIQVCRGVEKPFRKKQVNVFSDKLTDEATEMENKYSNDRSEISAIVDIEEAKILLTKLKKEDFELVTELMSTLSKR